MPPPLRLLLTLKLALTPPVAMLPTVVLPLILLPPELNVNEALVLAVALRVTLMLVSLLNEVLLVLVEFGPVNVLWVLTLVLELPPLGSVTEPLLIVLLTLPEKLAPPELKLPTVVLFVTVLLPVLALNEIFVLLVPLLLNVYVLLLLTDVLLVFVEPGPV